MLPAKTRGLSRISTGQQDVLSLGNLDARRDWGHAKRLRRSDVVDASADEPDDYVIATGEQYSVRDFVNEATPYFGMNIEWMGEGLSEVGYDWNTKRTVIKVDPKYFRPAEVETLLGDPSKGKIKTWMGT